jgi:hypothetical protein
VQRTIKNIDACVENRSCCSHDAVINIEEIKVEIKAAGRPQARPGRLEVKVENGANGDSESDIEGEEAEFRMEEEDTIDMLSERNAAVNTMIEPRKVE